MAKDKRDLLDILKPELGFVEKGGIAIRREPPGAPSVHRSEFTDMFELPSDAIQDRPGIGRCCLPYRRIPRERNFLADTSR